MPRGKRLERVEARGKNLVLTFEGGLIVRSHLRMKGRWLVQPVGRPVLGRPWLVLRGSEWQAVQRNGPVLELGTRKLSRLGPDIKLVPPAKAEQSTPFGTITTRAPPNAAK